MPPRLFSLADGSVLLADPDRSLADAPARHWSPLGRELSTATLTSKIEGDTAVLNPADGCARVACRLTEFTSTEFTAARGAPLALTRAKLWYMTDVGTALVRAVAGPGLLFLTMHGGVITVRRSLGALSTTLPRDELNLVGQTRYTACGRFVVCYRTAEAARALITKKRRDKDPMAKAPPKRDGAPELTVYYATGDTCSTARLEASLPFDAVRSLYVLSDGRRARDGPALALALLENGGLSRLMLDAKGAAGRARMTPLQFGVRRVFTWVSVAARSPDVFVVGYEDGDTPCADVCLLEGDRALRGVRIVHTVRGTRSAVLCGADLGSLATLTAAPGDDEVRFERLPLAAARAAVREARAAEAKALPTILGKRVRPRENKAAAAWKKLMRPGAR